MLEQNLNIIKEKIKQQCEILGKNSQDISIIAASKTIDTEKLSNLKGLGIGICGENRVQELLSKFGKFDTEWHFIGQLQTNKVKYIIDKVTLIHSVDRLQLAKEIQRQCEKNKKNMDILIEVNCAGEESKGGMPINNVEDFYHELKSFDRLRVRGLMSVLPIAESESQDSGIEQYYLQLKELYDKIKMYAGDNFNILSAGMSDDYLLAIKHGANMLRLGRVLFGERIYNK